MEVRFWGVRGSYPASGAAYAEFGHHTASVSVAAGEDVIVLDAGSGAAALGNALRGRPVKHLHILLSHFHHDHVIGLPFLLHGASPGTAISIHSALAMETSLEAVVRPLLSAPYFPDEAGDILDRLAFNRHKPGDAFQLGGVAVESLQVEHPGGSTAFRLEGEDGALVYATDIEATTEPAPALVALARNADLLIHDTMFTPEEIVTRRGWGHSTSEAALALAKAAGVRQLAGFHHSPTHDDALLRARERALAAALPGACLAREGQIIEVARERLPRQAAGFGQHIRNIGA